jgi:NAD(P)-dependent dehydrogenase (short-subunit alcohol dehydrogenase family)
MTALPTAGVRERTETETTRRFVWRPLRQPPLDTEPAAQLAGKKIVVIGGREPAAAAVTAALRANGALVLEPGGHEVPDGIIDLTLDEDFRPGDHASWQEALLRSVGALRSCYDAWAAQTDAQRIFYLAVTYFGGGMGYRDLSPQARPFGGLWAGLAKTLHHELPNCNAKVIDVDPAATADLPGIITRELYRWGAFEVSYRDGVRHTLGARREDAGSPTLTLDAGDVVLISGGGRGIGFSLATLLAQDSGCRVVITGRHPLPSADEPWAAMDDDAFARYQRELWGQRSTGRPLADIRAEITRTRQRRELSANLRAARADGLRIDYEVCDFTDEPQVAALIEKIGPSLSGVVHNAGVDMATRLHKMSDADVLRTARTKVEGFTNLFAQVRSRKLKFFCNVGSMSGRLSGMVGQIAYAAANDALTRLGFWAQEQADFPVMTLCWPVWERLGLITNYDAALRYMSPLAIQEGLWRWRRELMAPTRGEATFLGALGDALTPVQVRGFQLQSDLLGFEQTFPRIFHLGTPVKFRSGEELVSRVVLDAATAPALTDFEVGGRPAVPVSLLLESALASAAWVQPADEKPRLTGISDVTVHLDRLGLDAGSLEVRRSTSRSKVDGHWVVDVRFERQDADELVPLAELRLVYDTEPGGSAAGQEGGAPGTGTGRRWHGVVFPRARWQQDGRLGEVREPRPDDLWTRTLTPPLALPTAALENVVRSVPGDRLHLSRLVIHASPAETSRIEADPARGVWRIGDAAGDRPVLTVVVG